MKSNILLVILVGCLSACAETAQPFIDQPDKYGLFVASTSLYFNIPLMIQRDGTNEIIAVPVKKYVGNYTGYLVQALPPGRYYIYSYSPYTNVTVSLKTPEGFFDVQANCFNYGGYYDFSSGQGQAGYQNVTSLKDIAGLPAPIRKLAAGRNICLSSMGESGEQLSAAERKEVDPQ